MRSPRFSDLVKSEPTLLLHRGVFLHVAMRAQRVTQQEVLAALRGAGAAEAGSAVAVVLETDGSLSVLTDAEGPASTIAALR